jgi:hypothetical protein
MLDRYICGLNKIMPFRNTCDIINHDDIIFKEPLTLVLPDLLIIFKKIRKKKRLRVKRKVHSY